MNRRVTGSSSVWLLALGLFVGASASAQPVAYSGKLQIGFGDQDNARGFRFNYAVPRCVGGGPLVNPGTIGTTRGTLLVNGIASATPGIGGSIVFEGVQGSSGGAQTRPPSTCRTEFPGFANPRFRSLTWVGSAFFPGRKGEFTPGIVTAPVPATVPSYSLALGGGNEEAVSVTAWTTRPTESAPAMTFTGAAYEATIPFLPSGEAIHRIQPGPGRFGGGLPFSGRAGERQGIAMSTGRPCGALPNGPSFFEFGCVIYANGFLPGTHFFGTDAVGVEIRSPVTTSVYTPAFTYPKGLVAGRQDGGFAARTVGGSTRDQQGAIRTLFGGNTRTPAGTEVGLPIVSPFAYTGVYGEWTTGVVTHTDRVGTFTTIRKAQGFDIAPTPATRIANETRRIQLVSPWAATVRPVGPFGLPVPERAIGGVAVLTLNLIPAPEPGFAATLALGVGILGRGGTRKRAHSLR